MPHLPVIAIATIAAFLASLAAVRLAIGLAARWRYESVAGSEAHKVQTRNVPYGGGLAMAAALAIGLGVGYSRDGAHALAGDAPVDHGSLLWVYGAAVALLVLGALDDRRALGPRLKLVLQLAAAALAVWGARLDIDFLAPWPWLAYGAAWAWLVLVTNAFNLLDHADGLSGSVAAVCAAVIMAGAFLAGDVELGMLMACLAAVLAGFLAWNRPPARIYMGDAGALPLGFLIGVGTLSVTFWPAESGGGSWLALAAPLVITAIPLFDTAVVVVKRWRRGAPLMRGDRHHIGHRLGRLGLSPVASLGVVVALQVALAGSVFQLRQGDLAMGLLALLQDAAILAAVVLMETTRDHG